MKTMVKMLLAIAMILPAVVHAEERDAPDWAHGCLYFEVKTQDLNLVLAVLNKNASVVEVYIGLSQPDLKMRYSVAISETGWHRVLVYATTFDQVATLENSMTNGKLKSLLKTSWDLAAWRSLCSSLDLARDA